MQKLNKITFGSDFEMFVVVKATGEIVPCPTKFGGTKKDPLSIGNNCFRQIDGVAVELNTPVVDTLAEWNWAFNYCIQKANEILEPMGMEALAKTSHEFRKEQFLYPRHTEFGCTPSWCAYDWSTSQPDSESAGNLRTTGAHIHIGATLDEELKQETMERLVFCMDKCVGIPFLEVDKDRKRRELYGQAGEFRFKYNKETKLLILEYRSLGGGCLTHIPEMFTHTQKALELYHSDYVFTEEELLEQRNKINHVGITV